MDLNDNQQLRERDRVGLCAQCRHMRIVRSDRGSTFYCVEFPKPIRSFPNIPACRSGVARGLSLNRVTNLRCLAACGMNGRIHAFQRRQLRVRSATGHMRQNEMKLANPFG